MANPPCQSDDGNAAIFTGTNFDTGDSVMLCPACMVSFCATIIEGMTGLPVSALLDDMDKIVSDADGATETPDDDTESPAESPDTADADATTNDDSHSADHQ